MIRFFGKENIESGSEKKKPIYKPISSIREMVKNRTESFAEGKKVKEEHQRMAFNYYRFLKMGFPDAYESVIRMIGDDKKWKDLMGEGLYKLCCDVMNDVCKRNPSKIFEDETKEIKSKNLPYSEEKEEISNFKKVFFKIKMREFENDPQIISAFKGKEGILKDYTDSYISNVLDYMESHKNFIYVE